MSQALQRQQFAALLRVWLRRDMHLAGGRGAGLAGVLVMSSLFLLLGAMAAGAMVLAGVPRYAFATLGLLFGSMPTAMAVITDFGVAAVDIADQDVVGHRPVNDRTYLMARMATVAFYALVVGIPAQLPYALGGILAPGSTNLFPLAYLLVAVGVIFGTVSLVVLLYATIARVFGPRRLSSLVLVVQLTSVGLFFLGGPMIGPTTALLARVDLAKFWPIRFIPHAWAAAVVDVLLGQADALTFALALLALGTLVVLLVLLPSRLSMGYVDALSRQLASAASEPPPTMAKGPLHPLTLAGYGLARAALRDPQTRLRVVPTLVLPVVYACLMAVLKRAGDPLAKADFLMTLSGLMPAALLAVGPSGYLIATEFSSSWRASWIFQASPIERPGLVQRGVKLASLRAFVPGLVVYALVVALVWPLHHVAVVLLDVACAAVMSSAVASLAIGAWPASRPMQAGTSLRAQVLTFAALLIPIGSMVIVWVVVGPSIAGHLAADAFMLLLALPLHIGIEYVFDWSAQRGRPMLAVDPEAALKEERLRRSLWAVGAALLGAFSLSLLFGTGYLLWRLSGRSNVEGMRAASSIRAGGIALEAGDPSRALELATAGLSRNPRDADAAELKGKALLRLERFGEALAAFTTLEQLRPTTSGLDFHTAEALRGLKKCSEARAAYDDELQQSATSWRDKALKGKWKLLTECGDPAGAREALKDYVALRPDDAEAAAELGSAAATE